ncbi:MAG: homocysteine S-methyltransferase family protein, partial [Clostridia bacterium]|nr:homocysteine S-methyltransferase family protein [Clostridia bacterium]
MNILEKIRNGITYCDGGAGTLLQSWGLEAGEYPESWNITKPDKIIEMHRLYLEAGADIITSCTFGANRFKFDNLEEIITAAINNAKKACEGYDAYIALDIGPLGKMLEPLGDLPFETAVEVFSESIKIGAGAGADLVLIETMNDSLEAKAAVLAAKESCNLPVFVTCVYDETKKLMTGANPAAMIAMLEGLGADAIGMNCSLGPKQMLDIVPEFTKHSSTPIIVNPNAGLPRSENGKTVYDIDAEEFSDIMCEIVKSGATIIGGCCGTTPEHIRKTVEKTKKL